MPQHQYKFAFVMDQQVGLRTLALNLEAVAAEDPEVDATFVPVRYESRSGAAGALSRLPLLPSGVRGSLRGASEIRAALGDGSGYDAILWATWAAKLVPGLVAAAPAVLMMDMTPTQMEQMGELYGYSRRRARLFGGAKRASTARLYRTAEAIVPWSSWAARSLREDYGVPDARIRVVSPGVDLRLFHPASAGEAGRPADAAGGAAPVRLLFVGGHFGRKGGDLLVRWSRERIGSLPHELHLVTREEVPEAAPLPHARVYNGVANNSPELIGLYRSCDAFVLPTRADCYSLVSMEAMACGLPVVVSDIGGIPDIVADGRTGYLVPPDDYGALADRLDRLVGDAALRSGMAARALADARQRFDCRTNLGGVLGLLKDAARRRSPSPAAAPAR